MTRLQTQIVQVTAYPDRARVTRRGTIALEAGLHRIEVAELPLVLDTSSVRASGAFRATPNAGQGDARLLGVDVRKEFYQDTPTASVKELEDQIQSLEDQDESLEDQAETFQVQANLARSLAEKAGEQLARGVAFARTDMGQGAALTSFVAQELARTQTGLRELAVQRRELGKQLEQLRNQLQVLRGSRGRERYTAVAEVQATAPGELTLDLVYVVTNAGWQPLYDIRLIGPLVELTYLGEVTQRTGEDWQDVALILSTARPSLSAVLPELQPWYLNMYEPPVAKEMLRRAAKPQLTAVVLQPSPAPMAPDTFGAEPQAVEMEAVTAQVESSGASVTFRLPQKANVPADGEPHKVTVATAKLEPKLDYVTVPKLTEFAFRRATVRNSTDLMLLPGKATLFVEGDYIGSTPLKLVAPGEEFKLYLGVDDRVFVERKLKASDVDKKFLQDKRQLHYGYETELRNLRPDKIAVELHDQLPVARHESIKVRLDSADPKPAETSELGELTWKLALDPGTTKFVRFDYTVEHPRDARVVGLP